MWSNLLQIIWPNLNYRIKQSVYNAQFPYGLAVKIPVFYWGSPGSASHLETFSRLSVNIHYTAMHSCTSTAQFKLDITLYIQYTVLVSPLNRDYSVIGAKMMRIECCLLTMHMPQFYSARAGGDTAGLGIDGFHFQRATFCWNIHFGALELLHIHCLQTHNSSFVSKLEMYYNLSHVRTLK